MLFLLVLNLESCNQTSHTHIWTCPPQNLFIKFQFMWIFTNMQKIRLFHYFVLEIWLIKKSCNLIGWEHFSQYLRNKNFPKYGMFLETANNINFYYRKNSVKINDKIFNKFKKPCFLSIFPILRTKIFSGKSGYVKRNFIWISGTMPKFRKKLMIQLQENARPGGRTEGMMERRTDLIL